MKSILYDKKLIYLSIIPVAFLISSTFVNLIVIVGSFLFVFNSIKTRNFNWFKDKFFLLLIFFYSYLLINHFFFSYDKDLSFSRSIGFIRYILFVMALKYYFWPENKNLQNEIIKIWSYICIIVFFDCIFQFFMGFNILGFEAYKMGPIQRLSSFMNNEYKIGGFILVFGIICFSFITKQTFYSFIFLFLFSSSIALTGERANFYIFVMIIFLLIFSFKEKLMKKFIYVFIILLSFLITFNVKPIDKNLKYTHLKYRYIFFLDERYPIKTQDNNLVFSDQHNQEIIKNKKDYQRISLELFYKKLVNSNYFPHYYTAFQIFRENKFFGTGLKTFREKCKDTKYDNVEIPKFNEKKCSTHPHNFILELLSETGVIGLGLVLIIFLSIIKQNFFYFFSSQRNLIIATFFLILFIYFPLFPRGSFFTSWNAGLFWAIIGINMGIIYNMHKKK